MLAAAVGQAAGNLVVPATDAGKGIYSYLKLKYDYVKNLDQYFEKLQTDANVLFSKEEDVNGVITRNQAKMEKTHGCKTWLNRVKMVKQEFQKLKSRYDNASKGSCGLFRFPTRLKLSKDIVKMSASVVHLIDQMNLQDILVVQREPVVVQKKFARNDVPSLSEHVDKLLEFFKDDNIKRIGIFGMPGVGKTTIMETLNDEVEKHNIFDIVIWVTVSKEGNIDDIQQAILERLHIDVEGIKSETEKSYLISETLEKMKYLLLLDQVCTKIDLHHVGIHESHACGKVVLATVDRLICDSMEVHEEIKVERMSRDDARKLFCGTIGEAVDHPFIKPIAELILKQCGELPQVIKAVARHLRNNCSEDFWQGTLLKLRSPNMSQVQAMEEAFNVFRLIYDQLPDNLKNCLLYGASFPEDHEIYQDYLIECWKAEQLILNAETFRRARAEGQVLLKDLIDRHLFDQCRSKKHVKIPIIFRNAALEMANQHNDFELAMREADELEDYPPLERWRNARVISLMHADQQKLPDRPECYRISTLFLQKNANLAAIPTSFFDCMSSLKTLDLYGTGIESLPPSVSKLTNLRGLYLNSCCKLKMLPEEIGELTNLETLDIYRTGFRSLPIVIGKLTSLRCLRASFVATLCNGNHIEAIHTELVPANTIDRLSKLEELTIDVDPKESSWNDIAIGVAAEMAKLTSLTTLSFYFPTVECLEAFTGGSNPWNKRIDDVHNCFRSFKIIVGFYETNHRHDIDITRLSAPRHLRYCAGGDTLQLQVIREVLKQACAFELIGHQNVTSLSDFGMDEMKCLEVCTIQECHEMRRIVGSGVSSNGAFQWLKELRLCKLKKFDVICDDPLVSGSFASLTTLTLDDCPNVTKIFSRENIQQLSQLQHLRVQACPLVIEILEADIQSIDDPLPRLRVLELVSLEGLVSIHRSESFNWLSLEKIEIIACDKLANLSLSTNSATNLRSIRCNEVWWRALALQDDEIKRSLENWCYFV
ncbi:hypothetical protein Ancab_010587 [Ancistrocladus abbreviatus]